ncbi:DsbA family protein [Myxococcota bacterium]|nr:DsbA family protein [Myxococcota bacterium]MCZ7617706.1 DsbA family protein [Myxococcota bacterium]
MSLRRRLEPWVVAALTSDGLRDVRRGVAELRRSVARAPHQVLWFHQVDDPYSHLGAQVLERFAARWNVELVPLLVGPPPDEAAPERARLDAFARKDAADVAPGYRLAFPRGASAPAPALVAQATRILAGASSAAFPALAPRVGDALWRGDAAALGALEHESAPLPDAAARAAVAAGTERRHRLGHYLGGMFHYGGEWYWGVDRLAHLEERLAGLGLARSADVAPLVAPPVLPARSAASPDRWTLEFFCSLRSPYSYIAMERVFALPGRLPVDIVLRPVLPMVMRGLPVPAAKRLYIVLDTRREARRAGVPFGRVCDPVGRPVERAFQLYPWARERGRAAEFLHAFARAAFAEGVDTGSDAGLRAVVERAGLSWDEARAEQGVDRGWRDELEANRETLFALGLWGVPSFRLRARPGESDFCTWGQDRLWRVEAELHARLAGP